jgi:CRISPR/Cas system-associated exonuclease Cas4 (RecB family)
MHGGLHIFPSASNSVTKKQSQQSGSGEGFLEVVEEENYKAKQAYRDRVRAAHNETNLNSNVNLNSNLNSNSKNTVLFSSVPIQAENRENNNNIIAMDSEESTESLTPSCQIRFSDIYNYTEIEIQTRWKVLKKLENTDLDFNETTVIANENSPPPLLLFTAPTLPPPLLLRREFRT